MVSFDKLVLAFFQPCADWIDAQLHRSTFTMARICLYCALLLVLVAEALKHELHPGWLNLLALIPLTLMLLVPLLLLQSAEVEMMEQTTLVLTNPFAQDLMLFRYAALVITCGDLVNDGGYLSLSSDKLPFAAALMLKNMCWVCGVYFASTKPRKNTWHEARVSSVD